MWKVNWWKPKNFSLLLLAALALSACKKEEPQDVDLGYDYFPNTVGTFIEYEVDSSYYESGVETNTQFYVREEYTETFIDGGFVEIDSSMKMSASAKIIKPPMNIAKNKIRF